MKKKLICIMLSMLFFTTASVTGVMNNKQQNLKSADNNIEIKDINNIKQDNYLMVINSTAGVGDIGHHIPIYGKWNEEIKQCGMRFTYDTTKIQIDSLNFDGCVAQPDSYLLNIYSNAFYFVIIYSETGNPGTGLPAGEGIMCNIVVNISDEAVDQVSPIDFQEGIPFPFFLSMSGTYISPEYTNGHIHIIKIDADTYGPYIGETGKLVEFHGNASGGVPDPDYNWHWDFGDGNTSNEQNPLHEYENAGEYTATLTVTDSLGYFGNDTTLVTIIAGFDFYVDDNFNETTPGWCVTHFDNIQDAIDNSSDNERIFVYSGSYTENIAVNTELTIFGEDKASTIIAPISGDVCVQFNASNISFSGFTVQKTSDGDCIVLKPNADVLNLTECIFIGNNAGNGTVLASSAIVKACEFSNFYRGARSSAPIPDVEFIECNFHDNYYGLYNTGLSVKGCIFYNNNLSIRSSPQNIEECTFYENVKCIETYSSEILSCNFYENIQGIYCTGNNQILISLCSFTDNEDYAIMTGTYGTNIIYYNNFIDSQVVTSTKKMRWDDNIGHGNYWSIYDELSEGSYDNDDDGVAELPYILDIKNKDNYPLMNPVTNNPFVTFKYKQTDFVNYIVEFNASKSIDFDGDIVGYRWDFNNNGTWDTNWLSSPITAFAYEGNGIYDVKLSIKDDEDMISEINKNIVVGDNNPPEITNIVTDPDIQYSGEEIFFNCTVTDETEVDAVTISIEGPEGFTPIVTEMNQVLTEYSYENSFEPVGEYTYTIIAIDIYGNTASPENHFIIDNPPYIPSDPNPADDATNVPLNIVLSWIGGDPDNGDIITYDVYFAVGSHPSQLVSEGQTATSFYPGTLLSGKRYSWKILAHDNVLTTEGPIWEFTTQSNPPETPECPSGPSQGEVEVEYKFTTKTSDPDDNSEIYYQWDWGDEISDWIGPYESGEKVEEYHEWDDVKSYAIRVRAKDQFEATSDWSTIHIINIIYPEPNIKIGELTGGINVVNAEILNTGNEIADDVEWSISVEGGFLKLIDVKTDGTETLDPDETLLVTTDEDIHGIGMITITVTVNELEKKAVGVVFGKFVFVLGTTLSTILLK